MDTIKQTLAESELSDLVVADDLMDLVHFTLTRNSLVSDAKEIIDKHGLEFLPIVENEIPWWVLLRRRMLNKMISTKMLELQRRTDLLSDS